MKGRPPKQIQPLVRRLNTYRMEELGYYWQETGNWLHDQLQIEKKCFLIGHTPKFGGLGKFGHFKRIVDLLWNNPDLACQKRFVWNPWAEKMLREMCEPGCEELGIAGPTSAGKCIKSDTLVLMYDGSTRRADQISPGDVVMGDDSGPRRVQEVHSGRGLLYKISPEQGSPWWCTGNHTLVLKRAFAGPKSYRRIGEITEIEVEDYLKKSNTFRREHKQFCVGVDFEFQKTQFDARLLGIWLGDGHYHNCRISIPTSDPEILSYVKDWASRNSYQVVANSGGKESCPSYQIHPLEKGEAFKVGNHLRQFFKSCIRNGEKRIPKEYLVNSREVRMQLLAGLLDTDGYAAGTFFEIATKYAGLKDDIVFLARSLGFRVSAVLRMAKCEGKEFPSWRVSIAGNTPEIPTFRKKCVQKKLRLNSDCTGIKVEPDGEGDWVGFSVDGNHRFLLADFTVTHNSDPAALWVAVNYVVDPTHVKGFIMSTTIKGAKLRIWKSFREYLISLPEFPGKPVWSQDYIAGPDYEEKGFGESSGVQLLASEKSKEKDALEKMIGIKAPVTGVPNYDFEALKERFADLVPRFDEDTLRELLPRLMNLEEDRRGKMILVVDEATGLPESLLNAIYLNMQPGNVGCLQVIMLGNPNLHWDSFGRFCEPDIGWDGVTLNDHEWETKTGGKCIRFNGEDNPRITENNGLYSWMLTQERIEKIAADCGGKLSLGYYRMVLGMWSPAGSDSGVYTQADVEAHGAMNKERVVWGLKKPTKHSSLDCSFTADGDRPFVSFGLLGEDIEGRQVFEVTEKKILEVDIKDKKTPVNYQIVRKWKQACETRDVPPENAVFDSSGAGVVFADIVKTQWSSLVQGITASGKPLVNAPKGDKKGDKEVTFANRATQLWYVAHPYFRAGQIHGVTPGLAKEICSRQHDQSTSSIDGRTLKIESKKDYKRRVGQSPDEADSFFLLIEHCRLRHGFKHSDAPTREARGLVGSVNKTWKALKDRARRITHKKGLRS